MDAIRIVCVYIYFLWRRAPQQMRRAHRSLWLIVQPCDQDDDILSVFPFNGAPVELIWQGKTAVLEEKPVPVPLCPPQIPHGSTRDGTRASPVWGRRLTAWAMARPNCIYYIRFNVRVCVISLQKIHICTSQDLRTTEFLHANRLRFIKKPITFLCARKQTRYNKGWLKIKEHRKTWLQYQHCLSSISDRQATPEGASRGPSGFRTPGALLLLLLLYRAQCSQPLHQFLIH
jgi:hypothetical protein